MALAIQLKSAVIAVAVTEESVQPVTGPVALVIIIHITRYIKRFGCYLATGQNGHWPNWQHLCDL